MGATRTKSDTEHATDGRRASVIVCTFSSERIEQTVECVQSVLAQSPQPEQVIVVVDHNERLQAKLSARLPSEVEIVSNRGEPGLSSARNTAVDLSRDDPIVFIDDDAVASEHWLKRLLSAFDDTTIIAAGGQAVPVWEGEQPAWLPDEFLWVVGCSYRGLPEKGPVRNPLGCNMAFRAELFGRVGLFDPGMGRLGSRPLGCEETEFCIRAARMTPGSQFVMVAGAEVHHWVPQARGSPRYLIRRCYYEGISKALVRTLGDERSLDTERRYLRQVLPARLCGSFRALIAEPSRKDALGQLAVVIGGVAAAAAGYVVGAATFRLRPPRSAAASEIP